MIRVIVLEDHKLVRQSLVKSVEAEPGFTVVADVGSAEEALQLSDSTPFDIGLLDVELPGADGIEIAARMKQTKPEVRIVFLTMHDDDGCIRRAIEVGADGFIPKHSSIEDLIQALHTVAAGGTYLSPGVARRVMDLAGGRQRNSAATLTSRELEILSLLAKGLNHTEVAERLFVSVKTVKNHLTNVYVKLGVKTAAQAVAAAYRLGLVTRPSSAAS